MTRKGSVSAVREDQVKLKIDGQEVAICSYCKGSGIPYALNQKDPDSDNLVVTPESFKRRAYWLIKNPQYIIVHYLDEANKYYQNYL